MLIRAVAREELNRVLVRNWREAPASQNEWRVPALAFQIMVSSNSASSSLSRSNNYAALTESVIKDCFVHVTRDTDCLKYRMVLLRHSKNVYENAVSSDDVEHGGQDWKAFNR